jgi:hypothetical protein
MPKTVAAACGLPPDSDWFDATVVSPTEPGWYNVEASNLAKNIERLFWDGWRWLYKEGGKMEVSVKQATKARWQGAANPTGAVFQKAKKPKIPKWKRGMA